MAAGPLLALAVALAGCDTPVPERERGSDPPATREPRVELTVTPRTGDAPLEVRLEARLIGAEEDCPSLAWDFGNDDVLISPAGDCGRGDADRVFTTTYVYRSAGSFETSVHPLASSVGPSDPVQVLVRGPSPTPPVLAAAPGPTIIVATPVGRTPRPSPIAPTAIALGETGTDGRPAQGAARQATAAPPTAGPAVRTAGAPTARPADRTAAAPTAAAGGPRVLPADLYYVTAADGALWRLPASGGAPDRLAADAPAVDAYAVSPAGLLALASDGALDLHVPGEPVRRLADEGASDPVWSRDGRYLAYASDGVWLLDIARGVQTRPTEAGRPVAWSPDGERLLLALEDGAIAILGIDDGRGRSLPVTGVAEAAWLPDRDVVALGGTGLRLMALGGTVSLVPVVDGQDESDELFVRPDLRLLALLDLGQGPTPYLVDLTADSLVPRPMGPPLELPPGADFAWSPDGRTAASAGPDGLALLDPASGARVPLVLDAARQPTWLLSGRSHR